MAGIAHPAENSAHTVPAPRRPLPPGAAGGRDWYERVLGWPTAPGEPVRLVTGRRFDVLDVPAEAGRAALRHLGPASPVMARGGRTLLLVAEGTADELPGLLRWLEWGDLPLDLRALGAGALVEAPPAPPPGAGAVLPPARGRSGPQGAAVWLRPPDPGCEVEPSLPTLSAVGGAGGSPDLVRIVDTVATHCHRIRLRRANAQPLACS
ncbi:SCO3374 family protein [Streptomyces sp. NPDC008150]|uniref:SCO3374 family protein n=1 Tax=Streptomyces sp. NPDC008150 TaxID=3364816 RepID=UPI0036EDB457